MISISLCMIVKNEERCLARCLSYAANVADEIIIVDTGSTDKTKEIAAQFTDKIFDFEWINDFSAARNYSFSKATGDYILWLDADDIILAEDAALINRLKTTLDEDKNPPVDVVMLRYDTAFDSAGRAVFSCFRERLVRRAAGLSWHEPVHECISIRGRIINGDAAICHMPHPAKHRGGRNLNIYRSVLEGGKSLTPRGTYYYARELLDHRLYAESAENFRKFLDGKQGWVEDNIGACACLAACHKAMGNDHGELTALLESFKYDLPRPETCCKIGYYFKAKERTKQAVYWFSAALEAGKNEDTQSWGFKQSDFSAFIPHLELACLLSTTDPATAVNHNEAAAALKPDSPAVAHNRSYFASISPHTKKE